MSRIPEIVEDLRRHLALCHELLAVVERENYALKRPDRIPGLELYRAKKDLLPRLNELLVKVRRHRNAWQKLAPAERAGFSEVPKLLQQNQDLIMKVIVLDRENEQVLL